MPGKRRLAEANDDSDTGADTDTCHPPEDAGNPPKRLRRVDILSTLSDELLVRILSHFGVREILGIALVSRRYSRLTADAQLWRYHYWNRFVRPRAELIPRFKLGASRHSNRLHFDGHRSIYADGGFGRNGGLVGPKDTSQNIPLTADWKATYRMRHNWQRGRCYVDELQLQDDTDWVMSPERKTYTKFVDGLALTVNSCGHLRAWDLRTRKLIAQAFLDAPDKATARPLCLAVDSQQRSAGLLDVVVGFEDGTYDIWQVDIKKGTMTMRYRHQQRLFGPVISVAYMHPYVLTARRTGFIVLYSFNWNDADSRTAKSREDSSAPASPASNTRDITLPTPRTLDTVKSAHNVPQAVSIRRVASSYIASVAFSFQSIGGWCIGIQDFDIKPSARLLDGVTSRLATTLPMPSRLGPATAHSPYRSTDDRWDDLDPDEEEDENEGRPVSICYSHPYLLATLPDNTLLLHLCTSTVDSLSIDPGIRLWGHTSGVSDAVITPWGTAVSVTARGDEMRLWRVEGGRNSSVEVQPREKRSTNLEDKRTWVAFDEERVIALKERPNGRESFMVYDFT